jgi:putative sterol carrier protein
MLPFTTEWVTAFRDAIDADLTYRAAAAKWVWPVALVLDPAPEYGLPDGAAVRFDLHEGRCRDAALVAAHAVDAPFVLRAPYPVWKRVVTGQLDPVMGVALKQLRLDGSLATLMLHANAAKALVAVARTLPVTFHELLTP